MRIYRPALLVLLACGLAGLGVPAASAQSTAASKGKASSQSGKSSSGKSTASKSTASAAKKKTGSASGAASSSQHSKTQSKGTPSKSSASSKSSGKSSASSKKGTSKTASRRSRRQPGQKAPTTDRISEIQGALAKDGSFGGTPNGKWDDDTTSAVRRFQSAHGLNPSGKLDAPTLQRLGLGSATAGLAAPTPPPGAVSRLTSSNSTPASADSTRPQR